MSIFISTSEFFFKEKDREKSHEHAHKHKDKKKDKEHRKDKRKEKSEREAHSSEGKHNKKRRVDEMGMIFVFNCAIDESGKLISELDRRGLF